MTDEIGVLDKIDEAKDETLIFDVSDEALEIAASTPSGQVYFTLVACTGLAACHA